MKIVKLLLFLTLPIWGLILALWLLSLIPNGGQMPLEGFILFGTFLVFAGAVPLFSAPGNSATALFGKIFLFSLYFAVSAVAMFIVGWSGALGLFGLAK